MTIQLPDIPGAEQTPLVKSLMVIIEQLLATVAQQKEELITLKDEISVLKRQKKRPTFKPSKLDTHTDSKSDSSSSDKKPKRAGSAKRSKNNTLSNHSGPRVKGRSRSHSAILIAIKYGNSLFCNYLKSACPIILQLLNKSLFIASLFNALRLDPAALENRLAKTV